MKVPKGSISKIYDRSRYRVTVPVLFKVIEATQNQLVSDEALKSATIDISAGGVRFQCDLPLQAGDVLKLKLMFPSQEVIVIGKVVRLEKFTQTTEESIQEENVVALEFIELPDERRAKIKELITPKLSIKQEEPEPEEESQEKPAFDDGFFPSGPKSS